MSDSLSIIRVLHSNSPPTPFGPCLSTPHRPLGTPTSVLTETGHTRGSHCRSYWPFRSHLGSGFYLFIYLKFFQAVYFDHILSPPIIPSTASSPPLKKKIGKTTKNKIKNLKKENQTKNNKTTHTYTHKTKCRICFVLVSYLWAWGLPSSVIDIQPLTHHWRKMIFLFPEGISCLVFLVRDGTLCLLPLLGARILYDYYIQPLKINVQKIQSFYKLISLSKKASSWHQSSLMACKINNGKSRFFKSSASI